jgi:hypothetical protein
MSTIAVSVEVSIEIPQRKLVELMRYVSLASCRSPNNRYPGLAGVMMEIRSDKLILVATDGARMHIAEFENAGINVEGPVNAMGFCELLIPPHIVKLICRMSTKGTLSIKKTGSQVEMEWDKPKGSRCREIFSTLDGRFAPWRNIENEITSTATIHGRGCDIRPMFSPLTHPEFYSCGNDIVATKTKRRRGLCDIQGEFRVTLSPEYMQDAIPDTNERVCITYDQGRGMVKVSSDEFRAHIMQAKDE